jgi:hypothetical protein
MEKKGAPRNRTLMVLENEQAALKKSCFFQIKELQKLKQADKKPHCLKEYCDGK